MSKRPEPTYPHHPLLEDLPMMSDDEFESFCADIKDSGHITDACVLLDHKGKPHLLAGRHRDLAGQVVGIKPKYIQFDPKRMGDPWDFVVSQNVRRGQSTTRKTIEAVLLLERAPKARRGDGSLREKLAKRLNVAEKYVEIGHACYTKHRSLWREMISGKLEIAQARNRLGHAKKKQQIEQIRATAGVTIADCELRVGDNVELMSKMPSGSIRCIFADPPYNQSWKYRADPTGDLLPADEYLALCEAWMRECARLLTDDGSLFVVISDAWSDHFGKVSRRLAQALRERSAAS